MKEITPTSCLASAILTKLLTEGYNPLTFSAQYTGSRKDKEYLNSLLDVETNPICDDICNLFTEEREFWRGKFMFAALAKNIVNKAKFNKSILNDETLETFAIVKKIQYHEKYTNVSLDTNHFASMSMPWMSAKTSHICGLLKRNKYDNLDGTYFIKIDGTLKPNSNYLSYNWRRNVELEMLNDDFDLSQFNTTITESEINDVYQNELFALIK